MNRVFLLLASAALLAADASAARMNLLDLIGGGARRSSRSRQRDAQEQRQPIRVEHDAEKSVDVANDATNSVTTAADSTADNAVDKPADNAVCNEEQASTNSVATAAKEREDRPVHISSGKVYYDRKEGYAVFSGNVLVDGEDYQLHSSKAYVFFDGTNELKRVVATGSVAITNDTKRAYGSKASYYRKTGMVVLYGDDSAPAEVRDEAKGEDQIVRGSKIKFWIDSEQVEVVDARISAPVSGGLDDLKPK